MKVEEMMIKDVYKVNEEATVKDVVRVFVDHGISGVPIVNDLGELCGFISDGDIMRHIGKHKEFVLDTLYNMSVTSVDNRDFSERVKEVLEYNVMRIAKKKVSSVSHNIEVEEVATMLGKKQIKKLPILDGKKLVGIVSRGDIVRTSFEEYLKI